MLKLRPSFFFSFLIFIFLLQKPNLGSASSPKCISTERQALLTFKQSLTDPSGRLSSWSRPDCCKWRGVCCDRRTSYVIKIDLRNPNQTLRRNGEFRNGSLGGKIHPSLTRLKFLSYLDLSSNDFNFTEIPEFVGHIVSLRYLNLSFSSFSGEVPASFGNLSKLESLDLYAQTFSDDLFTMNLRASKLGWLSGLSSSLTYLNMGFASLSGAGENWLQDFSRLSKLKELHLFNCELRSLPLSLPSSANLKLLEVLDLSRNYFYSPTPNWLFDLTSLRKLFLQLVRLQGSISPGFKKLKLLETLDLSKNELSGEIPAVLGDLPRLKYLDLSENSFQGQIHRFLDALSKNKGNSSLLSLSLMFDRLDGTLPESLGALRNLHILDLSENKLSGSVPKCMGNLTAIVQGKSVDEYYEYQEIRDSINLSGNNINGEMPVEILDLTYLRILNLSRNSVAGSIPGNISKLGHLETLDLSRNRFSGAIPQSLAAISSLHTLNVSYNKLEGSIPKQLKFKDPSIYAGNELLCGKPLSKKCARKQQDVVVN
ncbi:receptor-like protein EIX1 [Brassica napus]|nr:receptor-like protein EIX1 [Brassica napus]